VRNLEFCEARKERKIRENEKMVPKCGIIVVCGEIVKNRKL